MLSMRTPEHIDPARACCATMETVRRYFDLLKATITEHGLRDKPSQVYNGDETGFNMEKNWCKVLARRGTKQPFLQAHRTRYHVSVLACFNAAVENVPPMNIYSKHFPGGQYTEGGPPFKNSYIVNRSEFAKVFRHPYQRLKDRGVVVEGFKECGIFPLNWDAINTSRLMPSGCRGQTTTATTSGPSSSSSSSERASAPPTTPTTTSPQTPNSPPPTYSDHPLVAAGLVPSDLAEVLTRVQYQNTVLRRVTAEAQVITVEEYERLLLQREQQATAAREA